MSDTEHGESNLETCELYPFFLFDPETAKKRLEERRRTIIRIGASLLALGALTGLGWLLLSRDADAYTIGVFVAIIAASVHLWVLVKPVGNEVVTPSTLLREVSSELKGEKHPSKATVESFRIPVRILKRSFEILWGEEKVIASFMSKLGKPLTGDVAVKQGVLLESFRNLESQMDSDNGTGQFLKLSQTSIAQAIIALEDAQNSIASHIGTTEIFTLCKTLLRTPNTEETKEEFYQVLAAATEVLHIEPDSERTGKALCDEVCLRFRALYLSCLTVLTFYHDWVSQAELERIHDLFEQAVSKMSKIDPKSEFIKNVEKRAQRLASLASRKNHYSAKNDISLHPLRT